MKKIYMVLILLSFLFAGCDSLRFAPSQGQKQNAWLHNRTTAITAETARSENCSARLQQLTGLSQLQSRAFTSYFGLPKEFPPAETAEDVLTESNFALARTVLAESTERPDAFEIADSVLEIGIGLCALLGGVYGTRAVGFLRTARTKSKALAEIIEGNELFKKQNEDYSSAFKQAHKDQSPQTRQIVTKMKA